MGRHRTGTFSLDTLSLSSVTFLSSKYAHDYFNYFLLAKGIIFVWIYNNLAYSLQSQPPLGTRILGLATGILGSNLDPNLDVVSDGLSCRWPQGQL